MATDVVAGQSATQSSWVHQWRSVFFAPLGDGRRRRRTSDLVRLVVALLIVVCSILVVRANAHSEVVVEKALSPPPNGVRWLVDVFWVAGSFGTVAVLLLLAALAKRWTVLRDLAVAAAGSLVVSGIVVLALGRAGGRPPTVELNGYDVSFPVLNIAVAVAVATAARPYLARGFQRLIEVILGLAALATLVAGHGLPVNVIGSMAIGWAATCGLRQVWGSPLGLPSGEEVKALLDGVDLHPLTVEPSAHQNWGVAHYDAEMIDGGRLVITFYGRDASESQFLAKAWQFFFYRDSGPSLAFTRLQQVEHEAYVTQKAERAGVHVPDVLDATTVGASHDAILISRSPAGWPLAALEPELVTNAHLDALFTQMLALRAAKISHGAISPQTIVIDPVEDTVALVDFRKGTTSVGAFPLDRDMAGAMASAAMIAGPERTAASAARVIPADLLPGVLGHLRQSGLDPAVIWALKGKKGFLEQVRAQTATDAGIDEPELVEPRRLSWNQVLLAVGTLVGGWALILVLINASHSLSTIRNAQWGWVVGTLLFCAAAYLASAYSAMGSVPGGLAFGRLVGLSLSNSFTNLAGGEAAALATNIRFFQQQGYDTTVAVSSGTLVAAASWIVKGLLFLIAVPLAWSTFNFKDSLHLGDHAKALWTVLAVVVVIGVVLGLIALVPKWRQQVADKLRPKFSEVKANFKQLGTQPRKIIQLFGGSIVGQLVVALALGSALHAFGAHMSVAALLIAVTMAGVIGSASPAGGGMGVVEASMILALTAGGISKDDATAAVFVQRLFSSYLPPIAGWFALMWMRKKEYL